MWPSGYGHVKCNDIFVLAQRENIDKQTLGDLFYDYGRPLPDIKIAQALTWFLKIISGLAEKFTIMTESVDTIFAEFKKGLSSRLGQTTW